MMQAEKPFEQSAGQPGCLPPAILASMPLKETP
jgi:hypothetical protein